MSRTRNKQYESGDRINIYLSKDITPEFMNWINKQSDLSSYFLYAARLLYEKTGNVDVSEVMPRKINFDIPNKEDEYIEITDKEFEESKDVILNESDKDQNFHEFSPSNNHYENWNNINDLDDDPFA